MKKHIIGFALFISIFVLAIFTYKIIYPIVQNDVVINLRKEVAPPIDRSVPVIEPNGLANEINTIKAVSIVADINSNKVFVQIDDDKNLNSSDNNFAKIIIFPENSEEKTIQTEWKNIKSLELKNSKLVFSCNECSKMSGKTNYYARIFVADSADDQNLNLRLDNEKTNQTILQTTPVLINSGKNK